MSAFQTNWKSKILPFFFFFLPIIQENDPQHLARGQPAAISLSESHQQCSLNSAVHAHTRSLPRTFPWRETQGKFRLLGGKCHGTRELDWDIGLHPADHNCEMNAAFGLSRAHLYVLGSVVFLPPLAELWKSDYKNISHLRRKKQKTISFLPVFHKKHWADFVSFARSGHSCRDSLCLLPFSLAAFSQWLMLQAACSWYRELKTE